VQSAECRIRYYNSGAAGTASVRRSFTCHGLPALAGLACQAVVSKILSSLLRFRDAAGPAKQSEAIGTNGIVHHGLASKPWHMNGCTPPRRTTARPGWRLTCGRLSRKLSPCHARRPPIPMRPRRGRRRRRGRQHRRLGLTGTWRRPKVPSGSPGRRACGPAGRQAEWGFGNRSRRSPIATHFRARPPVTGMKHNFSTRRTS